jgi:hypothetical protein
VGALAGPGPVVAAGSLQLRAASGELAGLLAFAGLLREVGGEAEGGKEGGGVEEGVDPGDLLS